MDSEKETAEEESNLSSFNMRMEASSPSYGSDGETKNHRDVAEHISSIEKENFNLKLRIYHMEEHLNSKGGQDFQSILHQKVENEELKTELDENQKLLQAANKGISCLKKEVDEEKKLRGKAENELSKLQTELRQANEEKQRMKKQIERLRDDARRAREKAAHSYESTEIQLNDSLNENRELQDKIEDLENNNITLEDELSAKESELARVQDENDDLVDEVERLRAENVRLASQASRVPRKPRSYDMGIQCESRMCEKACQTRNLDYAPRSRLPRPETNSRRMQRTTSVGNLSDRTSSPVRSYGSSRDLRIPVGTPSRYNESSSRYQSLVQGQNKELSSLRRQLDQARLSCTRLRTTLDDLQRADYLEQRRLISTARRTLRKLEGELENRDESATSDCASESDYDYDSNNRSSILPLTSMLTEIKSMIAGLHNSPKAELDVRRLRSELEAMDSGHPTSPNDLSDAQLLPGIVQDLQNLRLKLDQTVSSAKPERKRPLSFDSGCQTEVSGTTISLYNDELSALRDALSQKDCEIDKLRAEAIQREMHPAVNSSPIKHSNKRKSFFDTEGPLTPPLSSGAEDNFMPSGSDLRTLREGLNQGRLLSKSIYHKVELGVEDTEEMVEEVHDLVQLLDEMSRMLQKMQYKACSQESDNAENIRLRNKVHALEKMLATTVSRMQKNSLLKQGIDHQISSKSLGSSTEMLTSDQLNYTAGILGRARINLGNSTPSTSRATSLNGDSL
ncbi:Oidioi.mRNA.OKI2018_I69.XSR.g16076.t3.cds [Oikopleura dioica]|uniref:Oidioi.mRNA.OKI2018_I69.XSR.g16076.t3.cds n=1 Tax=Oikopleura dioica TaxID=34765 RepID=A0ABN7SIY1_OIKDI|nr:Oidioi.mRNA.OKI2018_I69.XSR.g16076.t3.cds [Oikopleura dioica]